MFGQVHEKSVFLHLQEVDDVCLHPVKCWREWTISPSLAFTLVREGLEMGKKTKNDRPRTCRFVPNLGKMRTTAKAQGGDGGPRHVSPFCTDEQKMQQVLPEPLTRSPHAIPQVEATFSLRSGGGRLGRPCRPHGGLYGHGRGKDVQSHVEQAATRAETCGK